MGVGHLIVVGLEVPEDTVVKKVRKGDSTHHALEGVQGSIELEGERHDGNGG